MRLLAPSGARNVLDDAALGSDLIVHGAGDAVEVLDDMLVARVDRPHALCGGRCGEASSQRGTAADDCDRAQLSEEGQQRLLVFSGR